MRTTAVAFLLSLVTAAVLTPAVRRLAQCIGAIDHALSSRKIHKRPIPRLGGIAIVIAFFAPILGLLVKDTDVGRVFFGARDEAVGLMLGGTIIALLGVYDDIKGADARVKLGVQFAVAGLAYWLGFRINEVASPLGGSLVLGWWGLPLTALWIAGVINAINLIDGLDGLAGGVVLISLATTFVAAVWHGEPLMALTTATLGGAVLGFLQYNFNPASIFMGDTGSMFLGFVLATSAIQSHHKSSTAVAIIIPVVGLGLPITDTLLAIARRGVRGAPLFQADRDHIHHRLLARGFSQRKTVLILYGVCVGLGLIGLALSLVSGVQAVAVLLGLTVTCGLLLRYLGYMRFERSREVLAHRRRNLELRRKIDQVGERLEAAGSVGHVWESLREAVPALGAACVGLDLGRVHDRAHRQMVLAQGLEEADRKFFRTRHSLLGERPDGGVIELGWVDGKNTIDRDTEIAIEQLCGYVRRALGRIERAEAPGRHNPTEVMMPRMTADDSPSGLVAGMRN